LSSSASFAFQREDVTVTAPDFDIVISNELLRAHHGFSIVPANEFLELATPAVFRDLE
jgi:hypothetical protein